MFALHTTFSQAGEKPKPILLPTTQSDYTNGVVPADGTPVVYESSISCNTVSRLELMQDRSGVVTFKREVIIMDNKEIPSKLIVQKDISFTTDANNQTTLLIPDDGLNTGLFHLVPD